MSMKMLIAKIENPRGEGYSIIPNKNKGNPTSISIAPKKIANAWDSAIELIKFCILSVFHRLFSYNHKKVTSVVSEKRI
jgi:hypothetical protein